MWALALALNNTQEMIRSGSGSGIGPDLGCEDAHGQLVPLHEFTYNNTLMGCLIQRSIQDIAFTGVSVSSNLQHKLHKKYTREIGSTGVLGVRLHTV